MFIGSQFVLPQNSIKLAMDACKMGSLRSLRTVDGIGQIPLGALVPARSERLFPSLGSLGACCSSCADHPEGDSCCGSGKGVGAYGDSYGEWFNSWNPGSVMQDPAAPDSLSYTISNNPGNLLAPYRPYYGNPDEPSQWWNPGALLAPLPRQASLGNLSDSFSSIVDSLQAPSPILGLPWTYVAGGAALLFFLFGTRVDSADYKYERAKASRDYKRKLRALSDEYPSRGRRAGQHVAEGYRRASGLFG